MGGWELGHAGSQAQQLANQPRVEANHPLGAPIANLRGKAGRGRMPLAYGMSSSLWQPADLQRCDMGSV